VIDEAVHVGPNVWYRAVLSGPKIVAATGPSS